MRVLLVDDSQDATWAMSHLLGNAGFEICVVADSREAVTVATEFQPDAICLDISMPYIDGYELAHAIREVPLLEKVAIISLSGRAVDPERAQEAGLDAHVMKPAGSRQLGAAILEAVGAKKSAR